MDAVCSLAADPVFPGTYLSLQCYTKKMSKQNTQLTTKLKNLPNRPGVYLMKNSAGKIIYIGKAKNLKNRVRTYFQKSRNLDPKTEVLVTKIDDFNTIVAHALIRARYRT